MIEKAFDSIAERTLVLRKSGNSADINVKVRIGTPYWCDDGIDAACPVEITNILGRTKDIPGIDPIHALKLAIEFAESLLIIDEKKGKLYWPDGEIFEPSVKKE